MCVTSYKKFIGIEYVNNSEASHTLFSDDFEPDKEIKKWIDNQTLTKDHIITSNINQIDFINNDVNNW